MQLTGRCLWEAISHQIQGPLGPVFNCHCSKCRRWHGSAFRTRASIRRSHFRWLSGEHLLSRFRSSDSVTKTFCSVCGSNLASYEDDPSLVGIAPGGLEQDPGQRPRAHIFTASKAPWHDINDDLPQFAEWPGSEAQGRATRQDGDA